MNVMELNVIWEALPRLFKAGVIAGLLLLLLIVLHVVVLLIGLPQKPFLKKSLLGGAQRSFYGLLDIAVREHFYLLRNIPLGDVIHSSSLFSPVPLRMRRRKLHWLLCDRRDMVPRCAIILVAKGGGANRSIERLREMCDRAALPILVYEVNRMANAVNLRRDVYQLTGYDDKLGMFDGVDMVATPSSGEHDRGQYICLHDSDRVGG